MELTWDSLVNDGSSQGTARCMCFSSNSTFICASIAWELTKESGANIINILFLKMDIPKDGLHYSGYDGKMGDVVY